MHCEPERWDINETRRTEASRLLTPEVVEAHLRQASPLRSRAVAAFFRALAESLGRRRTERRPRTLYARLATWSQ